ncbi:hypothetical protein HK097_003579, partial [Rhizophlyctis rosea]
MSSRSTTDSEISKQKQDLAALHSAVQRAGGLSGLERVADADLDAILELALEAFNNQEQRDMPDDQRSKLLETSKTAKILFITQVATKTPQNDQTLSSDKSPQHYIDLLRDATSRSDNNRNSQTLTALRGLMGRAVTAAGSGKAQPKIRDVVAELKVQCSCQSMGWLRQFVDQGGLHALFNILDSLNKKVERKPKHHDLESEILKLLKIIVNHQRNITDLLSTPTYLTTLVHSLDSPTYTSRTSAADFLLALIVLDRQKGHQLVLGALEQLRKTKGDLHVFGRV